jgi:hypothetical protein
MERNSSEQKSGFPVLPVVALLVLLVGGVLWWLSRPAPPVNDGRPMPTSAPTPSPTVNTGKPATMSYTIFLPNEQAFLSRKIITEKNPFPGTPTWSQKAERSLVILCQRLTALPRATKVLSPPKKDAKGIVTVNMSDEFMQLNGKHETTVGLVLDAIASTLGAVDSPGGKPAKVRILVEGKPITTLSEFDLSDIWTSSQPADETPPRPEDVS